MFTPSDLEKIPKEFEKLLTDAEMRIMEDIIRRILINEEITRSADWQIYRMTQLGESMRTVDEILKRTLELTTKQIDNLYNKVIEEGYSRDEDLYKSTGKKFIPYKDNEPLQQLVEAVKRQTNDEFRNITQSTGFTSKKNGRIEFSSIADTYHRTLDNAMMDITTGTFDHSTVIKRAIKELTDSGLRTIVFPSFRSVRVESAARTAIMTGVTQVTAKINDMNAEKLETDYFEVSWHATARPSHQEWQGRVYSRKELEEVCGLGTGPGLCGWNCYHSYYPFIPGISVRNYTDEQLAEMNAKENVRRDYKGKSYTSYEATQHQRALERLMRKQRQEIKLLEKGGADENDIINAKSKYRSTMAQYAEFSKQMELPQEMQRVYADGLKNVGGRGKLANTVKSDIINPLPNADNVRIPMEKFTQYALNPLKEINKSTAFKDALGYTMDNAEKLVENIRSNVSKYDAVDKGVNDYGHRYEINMSLTGENGKVANVKTGWLVEKETNVTKLTSAYVTSKKRKE